MSFLLERQDPATGAFMDSGYPLFTYFAPTENVVEALHALAQLTGQPLKLKCPLRFLDQIPELLTYPPHEMSGFRREEARSAWPEGE
jgi:hypothetical protein